LYQPVELPEFQGRQVTQPCSERWELIRGRLRERPGRVVDLGCHTGWFCRQFARLGWRVTGVDRSADWLQVAEVITRELNLDVDYRHGEILEWDGEADVALLLSVLMYLFDDETRGWAFLKSMSERCPAAVVDFGGMYADRLPFTDATFEASIKRHTAWTRVTLLGTSAIGRPLYWVDRPTTWWVVGGTCSGKKTLINRLVHSHLAPLARRLGVADDAMPAWLEDGQTPPADLATPATDILVRWQWGREVHAVPGTQNAVILLAAAPEVLHDRAARREGSVRWTARQLGDESMAAAVAAGRMAERLGCEVLLVRLPDDLA
jgi:SAM-dependent methyltransferase